MGSGLSLTYDQVKNIIERDLNIKFKELEHQKDLNRYTDDGIEIYLQKNIIFLLMIYFVQIIFLFIKYILY